MERIQSFEDLIAWQKARALTREIYFLSNTGVFRTDYVLRDQIRRASVSIMSNIAEGFERGGRKEFHYFLVIAKASAAELRSQLYIAHDIGYLDDKIFSQIMQQASEVSRILGGLRSAVYKKQQ